jgi:transposase
MRVFISVGPIDFRCGIDGLSGVCKNVLKQDPFSGAIFGFINKGRTSIKLLVYDGQGLWMAQKRLSEGRFKNWGTLESIHARDLLTLIWNGDPFKASYSQDWKPLIPL